MKPSPSEDIPLPAAALDAVFPFHFAFGPDLRIVRCGAALARACPRGGEGRRMDELFEPVSPEAPFEAGALFRSPGAPCIIREKATGTLLRGQVLSLRPERDRAVFLGSPGLPGAEAAARRSDEQRMALQIEVARALAESEDMARAVPRLLQAICSTLGWQVGLFWTAAERELRVDGACEAAPGRAAAFVRASGGRGLAPGVDLPGRVWTRAAPEWVGDMAADAQLPRAAAARSDGLHGAFAFPIPVGRRVWGVMEFLSGRPAEPDEALLKTAGSVGCQIGQFIARQEAEAALREALAMKDSIVEGANYSIVSTDLTGTVMTFNRAAERMTGYAAAEVVGRHTPVLLHDPAEIAARAQALSRELGRPIAPGFAAFSTLAQRGIADEREWTYLRKDGSRFPVMLSVTALKNDAGTVSGYLGIAYDITERKASDQKLRDSESRQRAITDCAQDAILMMDPEGRISHWNPAAERILGHSTAEAMGRHLHDLIAPARYRGEHRRAFEHFRRTGMGRVVGRTREMEALCKDGREISVQLSLSAIQIDGRWHAVGILRDVTESKRTAEELRRQSRLQQLLMEISSQYINLPPDSLEATLSDSLRDLAVFVGADRAYIFDYDFAREICINTHEWCAEGIAPQIRELQAVPVGAMPEWVQTHRGGAAMYIPDVAALPPGALRATLEPQEIKSLLAVPMMNGPECVGFVGFDSVRSHHHYSENEQRLLTVFGQMLVNVRMRRRAEEKILETHRRLEEASQRAKEMAEQANAANRTKSDFLATVSHELRTPMNAIIGMTNLLLGTPLDSRQKDFAAIVARSGESLLEIINEILDYSRIESGAPPPLEEETFSLRELMDGVVRLLRPRAEAKGLALLAEVDAKTHDLLRGDGGRIRQVLVNLVGNGIKFTDHGRVTVRVRRLPGSAEARRLRFEVEDTGIGIDRRDIPRLFQPFTQLDSGALRRRGGTGLGLAISQRIVEAMGGRMDVRSSLGRGSVFAFELEMPAVEGAAPEADAAAAKPPEEDRRPESPPAPAEPPMRILVAEDHDTNRRLVQFMLEALGQRPDFAGNGVEAVEAWERQAYDLILMDCQMPKMDGFEATREIRRREAAGRAGKKVRIVALTANAMKGSRERCIEAGMDGFISKPFRIEQLRRALDSCRTPPAPPSAPAAASDPESPAVADLNPAQPAQLWNEIGGGAVRPILEDFIRDLPGMIDRLTELAKSGRLDDLALHAHAIRGAGRSGGLDRLCSHLFAMEEAAKAGDAVRVAELAPVAAGLAEAGRAALRNWLAGQAGKESPGR